MTDGVEENTDDGMEVDGKANGHDVVPGDSESSENHAYKSQMTSKQVPGTARSPVDEDYDAAEQPIPDYVTAGNFHEIEPGALPFPSSRTHQDSGTPTYGNGIAYGQFNNQSAQEYAYDDDDYADAYAYSDTVGGGRSYADEDFDDQYDYENSSVDGYASSFHQDPFDDYRDAPGVEYVSEDEYSQSETDEEEMLSSPAAQASENGPYFTNATHQSASAINGSAGPGSTPTKTSLADILEQQRVKAQGYWSSANQLGFGEAGPPGKRRRRKRRLSSTPSTFDHHDLQQGAPIANPYFLPTSTLIDEITSDPFALDPEVEAHRSEATPAPRGDKDEPQRGKRGRGRPGWKWALKGTPHDPAIRKAEERAKRGDGRRGRGRGRGGSPRRGRPPGPRRAADPGREFKHFQTRAVSAMMAGDLEEALSFSQQAVKANPEVPAAHSVLSNVLRKLGREEDSLGALMSGAVVQKDAQLWINAAERTLELVNNGRLPKGREQALWCYNTALQIAKTDTAYTARAGCRDMQIELGDFANARINCKAMLGMRPHDLENIRISAELAAQLKEPAEIGRARLAYEATFEAKQAGPELEDVSKMWSHVNIYLDLVDRSGDNLNGIRMLKSLARWILGRKDESFWDSHADKTDLEFDSGHERRAYVGEFQQGKASRDKEQYGDGLPLEIRAKLGLFRIKLGREHHEEATKSLNHLLDLDDDEAAEYFDVLYNIADILRRIVAYELALRFYEKMVPIVEGANEEFMFGIAECYNALNRYDEAEEAYRTLMRQDKGNAHARIRLAKLYERRGLNDQALPLIREVISLGRRDIVRRENLPLPPPKRRPRTIMPKPQLPPVLQSMPQVGTVMSPQTVSSYPRDVGSSASGQFVNIAPAPFSKSARAVATPEWNILTAYQKLENLWPAVQSGDKEATEEWMDLAARMVELFREQRAFFPLKNGAPRMERFTGYGRRKCNNTLEEEKAAQAEREAYTMINRLDPDGALNIFDNRGFRVHSGTLPKDFQGVQFGDWHRLISNLVLLYADRGEQSQCYDMVQNVLMVANVFYYDTEYSNTTNAVALACALAFNDSNIAYDIAREYSASGNYVAAMPYQLLAALTRLCHGGDNALYTGRAQKFMTRAVRNIDYLAMPAELRDKINWSVQEAGHQNRLAEVDAKDRKLDPGVLTIYGNIMAMTPHGNSALPNYLRALALQPDNPSVNLGLGLTYMHNAMKRSTENRHYGIQQGLSFVQRYYEIRIASGQACHVQEAEYNMAKTWQMLGLMHLAIPGFEKVLALSEHVQAERAGEEGELEDFAKEAAYALQQMFALAGNQDAAQAITEQWLVI